jgi:uncharacterized protein
MRRRQLMLIAILGLLHAYVGWRILPDLPLGLDVHIAGAALLGASFAAMVLGLNARSLRSRKWSDRIASAGLFATGWFSSLCVLALLRDLLLLPILWLLAAGQARLLEAGSAALVVALAVLATTVGFVNARRRARIVRIEVPIADLPPELHGFSIAQLSDLHVGRTIKRRYVEAIVAAVNELHADLVAVTGDVVDGPVQELSAHTAPLAELKARYGTFFVTGNHEYYSGEAAWRAEFERLGLRVLMNEHVVLEHRGASLVVAGVTDYSAHRFDTAQKSDPQAALAGAPANSAAKILLAHQPRSAPEAARAGFDLQLSGHTHGGQFWPWMFFVRFQQPFTAGLHRLDRLWVYISRGTGYWGPPKRFGAPSEITLLRLVPLAAHPRPVRARRGLLARPIAAGAPRICAAIAGAAICATALTPGLGGPAAKAAAPAPRDSQAPAPTGEPPVQDIEVVGVRPGPSLWRVSKGDHVVWLLGTLDPLPKRMTWRSREVENVVAQAQEVLAGAPSVSANIGPISIIKLYVQYRRTEKIPEKENLHDWLSPPLYARFTAVKLRFDPHDREIEKLRPMMAARRLYERAIGASHLTSHNEIESKVFGLAREHHVPIVRTSIRVTDPRGILTEAGEIPRAAEIACLAATIDRLETDLDAMKARARDWSLGDVDALRGLPYPRQREVCTSAAESAPQIKALLDRAGEDWEADLETALTNNRTTLAMKPIYDLIGPNGTLAVLRAKGYTVEGP